MLDLHKAQRPEDKDWFKETREAKFGPLDQVDMIAVVSIISDAGTKRCPRILACALTTLSKDLSEGPHLPSSGKVQQD